MHTTSNNYLNNLLKGIIAMALVLTITNGAQAQSIYKGGGKQSVITLYGTSTMHDWNMVARVFTCDAQFVVSENQITGLQSINMTLPVHNLKSEHDGMNDNAYESLKADDYKNIVFKASVAKVTSTGGNKYQITASGNLTIAGVTKPVTINAPAVLNADGSISCSGSVPLKLSEYGISRPSFMLGTMKVGDALTLNFALMFSK